VLKARKTIAWGFQPQVDVPFISGVLKARRWLAWGF